MRTLWQQQWGKMCGVCMYMCAMCVCVCEREEREREVKSNIILLWLLFILYHCNDTSTIRLCSLRDLGGTVSMLKFICRKTEQQRIKTGWPIRTAMSCEMAASNQSAGIVWKSTLVFLQYISHSGRDVRSFFFSHVSRFCVSPLKKFMIGYDFSPGGYSTVQSLITGGVAWDVISETWGSSEFIVCRGWPGFLSCSLNTGCGYDLGSSESDHLSDRDTWNRIKWRTRSEMPRDLALSLMCNMEADSLRNISLDFWLWKIRNIPTGLERMF